MNSKIKTVGSKSIVDNVYYSIDGISHEKESDVVGEIASKIVNSSYYIKVNSMNEPYQPKDKSYLEKSIKAGKRSGFPIFSWKKVNKDVFSNYLAYLSTNKLEFLQVVKRN